MAYLRLRVKIVGLLAFLASAAVISGCSSGLALSKKEPLPENAGLITVELVDEQYAKLGYWDGLEIWSFDEKKVYYARPVRGKKEPNVLYLRALPPGRYRLDAVRQNLRFGSFTNITIYQLNTTTGIFHIKAGHVTNLGALRLEKPEDGDGTSAARIWRGQVEITPFLDAHYPVVADQVADKSIIGWDKSK